MPSVYTKVEQPGERALHQLKDETIRWRGINGLAKPLELAGTISYSGAEVSGEEETVVGAVDTPISLPESLHRFEISITSYIVPKNIYTIFIFMYGSIIER